MKALLQRYNAPKEKYTGRPISYNEIDATTKWIEYSLDEAELRKLLHTADFTDRFDILKALKTVESKIEYMYKHKNFNLEEATFQFKRAKRLLRI